MSLNQAQATERDAFKQTNNNKNVKIKHNDKVKERKLLRKYQFQCLILCLCYGVCCGELYAGIKVKQTTKPFPEQSLSFTVLA